jgi:hypothetical protein
VVETDILVDESPETRALDELDAEGIASFLGFAICNPKHNQPAPCCEPELYAEENHPKEIQTS